MEGAGTGYSEAGRREATGLVGHATMGAVTLRPLPGSRMFGWTSGGVARASLNPRLIAGIPPGWWKRVELSLGWRGFRAQ